MICILSEKLNYILPYHGAIATAVKLRSGSDYQKLTYVPVFPS
jgi:hypothetical protein